MRHSGGHRSCDVECRSCGVPPMWSAAQLSRECIVSQVDRCSRCPIDSRQVRLCFKCLQAPTHTYLAMCSRMVCTATMTVALFSRRGTCRFLAGMPHSRFVATEPAGFRTSAARMGAPQNCTAIVVLPRSTMRSTVCVCVVTHSESATSTGKQHQHHHRHTERICSFNRQTARLAAF